MSVDLFCYTSDCSEKASQLIRALVEKNADLFPNKFSISEPRTAGENHKDIALENHFFPESVFLIHLSDKNSADLVANVSDLVKNEFGKENILILHNNDRRM
jgi:hypothetical protein